MLFLPDNFCHCSHSPSNIITFRQLLIRYDAFCRTFDGMSLNEWHLQRSVLDVDHPVHGLFGLEGVDDLEKKIVFGMQMQSQQSQSQLQQQQQQQQQQSHEEEVDGVLVQKEEVEGKAGPGITVFSLEAHASVKSRYIGDNTDYWRFARVSDQAYQETGQDCGTES